MRAQERDIRERRPSVLFAMQHGSEVGFVQTRIANLYDRVAECLRPDVRSYLAYPSLSPNPVYTLRTAEAVEANLYNLSPENRQKVAEVIRDVQARVIVYIDCLPSDVDLPFLRRLGVRTISSERYCYPPGMTQTRVQQVAKRILRGWFHYNIHDLYVGVAHHQGRFLRGFAGLPADRVRVVESGVDTEVFSPGPPPDPRVYGLPATRHYALAVCQARPEKRGELLAEVAARVFARRPALSLTFVHVGGGPCLEEWRARARKLGVEDRVFFLGERNDLPPLYRLASFLVHASALESFGLVLIEAMACGKPVIVSDSFGPREILGHGPVGALIGKDDIEGFASAVLRYAEDDSVRDGAGEAGYALVRERYSLAHEAEGWARAVRSLVWPGGRSEGPHPPSPASAGQVV